MNREPIPQQRVMEKLNSTKTDTVYVGDSDVDIKTAANAGIPCISVLWGFRDADFLKAAGGTVFAASPAEMNTMFCTFFVH